jgi:co-chaperonin GroES (HSP10)
MIDAAHNWLDQNEDKDNTVLGLVVTATPSDDEDGAVVFAVGTTHEVPESIIVEVLMKVVNQIIGSNDELRLVVSPKIQVRGQG